MIRQLAHLCLLTHQLPAMTEFYRERLGLSVKFTFKHDDGGVFGHYFQTGAMTFVEIFDRAGMVRQWGGEFTELRSHIGSHFGHLCFEVTGLEEFCATLKTRGVTLARPLKVGMCHSKQAWIHDPDGNMIELMEYTPKSWQL